MLHSLIIYFKQYNHLFDLPEQYPGVITPWLAFPLVIKKNKYFKRKKLQIYLEKNNIQTRTIFTGNILKQPIMRFKKFKKINNAEAVSNNVMENGILIGCHQDLKMKDLKFITITFDKFLKRYLI